MKTETGTMTVGMRKGSAIVGRGTLYTEPTQVYFDYNGKSWPSRIDWKDAVTLTFKPDMGRVKDFDRGQATLYYQAGWVGPRIVLQI